MASSLSVLIPVVAWSVVGCSGSSDTEPTDSSSTSPSTSVVELDVDVAPVVDGDWVRPGLLTTWHWQRTGTLDPSIDADLFVVDAAGVHQGDVAALQAAGSWVFCPLHVSMADPAGPVGASISAAALGHAAEAGAQWLDVRRGGVHDAMLDQLDVAVQVGCDGVQLSGLAAREEDTGFSIGRDEQLAYDRFLFNAAHQRGLAVIHTDAPDLVADLVDYADLAMVQGCHEGEWCDALLAFEDAAKPVLDAEFAVADVPLLCRTALIAGTRTLVLDPALDGNGRTACDTDFPSTTGLASTRHYTTYYGRDAAALADLATLDLAIVQPLLTSDQRHQLQTNARVPVYLSIGEIGLSNTYLIDGREQLGQVVYDAHPEWFLGKNPFFDSWFADTNQTGWQDFVLEQAELLLDQGYDGLFMDTVDTVDVYPDTIPGMVRLIERLREAHPDAILIQNRGMNVIPMSGPFVDALMFEVFSSTYHYDQQDYVRTDVLAPGYAEIVQKAVDYRLTGGVVLAQDFAEPGGDHDDLICYARMRGLRHLFVPAFADKFFQHGRYDYPEACPWPDPAPRKVALSPGVAHVSRGRTTEVVIADGTADPLQHSSTLELSGTAPGVTATLSDPTLDGVDTALLELTASASAPAGVSELTLSDPADPHAGPFDVAVVVHDETVWVTNAGLSNVVAYDEPSTLDGGLRAPDRMTGDVVAQPYAVAVDGEGGQWVVENVGDPAAVQPAGRLLHYAPFDLTTPDLVITNGLEYPTGVAVDQAGRTWVANSALDWTGTPRGTPFVGVLTVDRSQVAQVFRYTHASYGYPRQIAIDPAGRVWLTTTYGLVLGFEAFIDGNYHDPFAVLVGISGSSPAIFDTVRGLTFDSAGDLWLTGSLSGVDRVVEIPAGTWTEGGAVSYLGTAQASAVITSGLYQPWGVDLDGSGRLWVVNATDAIDDASSRGSLIAYDTPSTGATPSRTVPLASRYTLGLAIGRP